MWFDFNTTLNRIFIKRKNVSAGNSDCVYYTTLWSIYFSIWLTTEIIRFKFILNGINLVKFFFSPSSLTFELWMWSVVDEKSIIILIGLSNEIIEFAFQPFRFLEPRISITWNLVSSTIHGSICPKLSIANFVYFENRWNKNKTTYFWHKQITCYLLLSSHIFS